MNEYEELLEIGKKSFKIFVFFCDTSALQNPPVFLKTSALRGMELEQQYFVSLHLMKSYSRLEFRYSDHF